MMKNKISNVDEGQQTGLDEIGQILADLQKLEDRAPSPVIRACLEEARFDIAHLVAIGDKYQDSAKTELEG